LPRRIKWRQFDGAEVGLTAPVKKPPRLSRLPVDDLTPLFRTEALRFVHARKYASRPHQKKDAVYISHTN
jgi:hypothetical protein